MNPFKNILLAFFSLLITITGFSQDAQMADTMRSNGRIYVVVAVVVTILLGLIMYVYRLDRKMTKLEREDSRESGVGSRESVDNR